jgi:transcriptional regulator with XRE-family HTH domain
MLANEPAPQDLDAWAEALGHTIKVVRTDLGFGRRRLAGLAGISYSYLSAIENGDKVPSAKILHVLAERLELQPHELYAAAEARLARGQRPADATMESDAAIIEAQEQRFLKRQSARLGIETSPQTDELHNLIDRLQPRDVALILEMARRLARAG